MIKQIIVNGLGSYGEETVPIEFGNGKNVIVGENATGKSALLFAIEVGLLGSLEDWDLRDVINDNCSEAEVTLDLTHPKTGNILRINRRFRKIKKKKSQKVSGRQVEVSLQDLGTGEMLANTPQSVEATLEAIGIDKNTFVNVVHVKQGKIDRILKSSVSQREIFDKLFRIHDLKNAVNIIGSKRADAYSGLVGELSKKKKIFEEKLGIQQPLAEEYDSRKIQLETLQNKLKDLHDKLKEMREKLEKYKEIWERTSSLVEKIEEAKAKIGTASSSFDQADAFLRGLYSQLEKIERIQEQICLILEEAAKSDNSALEYKIVDSLNETVKSIEERESEVAQLKNKLEEIQKVIQDWIGKKSQVEGEINKLESQIGKIKDFVSDKTAQPKIKCELCGSVLKESDYEKHLEEIDKQREMSEAELSNIKESLSKINTQKNVIEEQLTQISALTNEKNLITPLINPIKSQLDLKLQSVDDIKQANALLDAYLEEFSDILGGKVSIEKVNEEAARIKTDVDTLPVKIDLMTNEANEIEKDEIPKLEEDVEKREKAKIEVSILQDQIQLYTRKIDFVLNEIRPALRDIQPIVRRLFLDSINKRAISYFTKLYGKESKYKREDIRSIWIDDEYRFWVDRLGHSRQAIRLSGGQRIIVSICFLFAFLDELGSSIGFLLLDEPSNHLDDKRVEELIKVLKELQNVPQLIVVDHKQDLIDVADVKYGVTLENGLSKIARIG